MRDYRNDSASGQPDVLAPRQLLPSSDVPENRIDIVTEPGPVSVANGVELINDWISPCSLHDQIR